MDREGRPTTDPEVAIDGLLMPIGGFKGTGLAMIMVALLNSFNPGSSGALVFTAFMTGGSSKSLYCWVIVSIVSGRKVTILCFVNVNHHYY